MPGKDVSGFGTTRRTPAAVIFLGVALCLAMCLTPHRPALAAGACEYVPPWIATGDLITARAYHTATLLTNGKVLAVGALLQIDRDKTELYDPATGDWTATGNLSLQYGRYHHTATLLQNGKVLVAGGWGGPSGSVLSHAELYDPSLGTWTATTPMNITRENHTATLLADGRVLVMGGRNLGGSYPSEAEIYNPGDGTWTLVTSSSLAAREFHTATLLTSGAHASKVLVAGGYKTPEGFLDTTVLFNPADLTFSATNKHLTYSRFWHTATLLPNGLVLVVGGGSGNSNTAELINPEDTGGGFWPLTSYNLATGRYCHTATLLPNGMVLVAGGENSGGYLNSFETYDPVAGQWVIDCTFPESRSQHTATLLPNGQVLMAGGYNGSSFLNSAVLWDYAAGSWAFPSGLVHPNLYVYRDSHTATLLATGTNAGKVLVLGHYADLAVELFDPVTENWSLNGELLDYRGSPTATLLGSGPNAGKVLVVAGWSESGEVASTEIYDPGSGISVGAGDLSDARSGHTATLLADGRVLVAGGYGLITNDPEPIYDSLDSVELYEPHGGWTTVDSMQEGRSGHTATLLPSGKVLVVGGYYKDGVWEYQRNSAELYNPATGTWLAAAILGLARAYHTATLLPSGKVLVAGGYNYNDGHLTSAEIYDPANGTWSPTGELVYSRASHTATLLPSGKVLVTGGWGYDTIHSSAEIYDPATGTWTETAYFPGYQGRAGHTATLLPSGKVLAAAGSVGGDPDNTAELYDPGLGFSGAWRPYIEPFEGTPILSPGGYLYFQGAGLRGKSEASGGGTNNSSTGYPLVQVRRLDSERILWLPPSSGSFSDTEFTSANFQDVQDGWCLITVITNGIPSLSRFGRFAGGSPTGVELASFTAAWDKKRVVLKWETYTEKNNVGFYLWRTEAGQDAYTRLTRDLIPARGTATMGAAYSYADYAVVRGREYRYKLEDVDTKGASTFHGPVSAAAGPGKKTKEK